jgi:hypothetical protein
MLEHKIRMRDGSVNLAQSGQEGMLKHFEIWIKKTKAFLLDLCMCVNANAIVASIEATARKQLGELISLLRPCQRQVPHHWLLFAVSHTKEVRVFWQGQPACLKPVPKCPSCSGLESHHLGSAKKGIGQLAIQQVEIECLVEETFEHRRWGWGRNLHPQHIWGGGEEEDGIGGVRRCSGFLIVELAEIQLQPSFGLGKLCLHFVFWNIIWLNRVEYCSWALEPRRADRTSKRLGTSSADKIWGALLFYGNGKLFPLPMKAFEANITENTTKWWILSIRVFSPFYSSPWKAPVHQQGMENGLHVPSFEIKFNLNKSMNPHDHLKWK